MEPPHWVLVTVVRPAEQDAVCVQVEPSDMVWMKSKSVERSTLMSISVTEKALEEQEKLGQLLLSWLTVPLMHLSEERRVRSRFLLPKEFSQVKPEKLKSSKLLKLPVDKLPQEKPDDCFELQELSQFSGVLNTEASDQPARACCVKIAEAKKTVENVFFMMTMF